jgi:energy-converting hydrogenase Eha subunit G
LKVSSLEVDVEVEAVAGASVDAASDMEVGMLSMVEPSVGNERAEWLTLPTVLMIFADLMGRSSMSSRVIGGKSRDRTDWKAI